MLNQNEDERVRYDAVESLIGLRTQLSSERQQQLANDLRLIVGGESPSMVQLRAAWGLGYLQGMLPATYRKDALDTLANGFKRYGKGCDRPDGAFGWRIYGNAMLQFGQQGRDQLEEFRCQSQDRWLAWFAYEVVHLPHRSCAIVRVDEREAIETHNKFAPPFPGYRGW